MRCPDETPTEPSAIQEIRVEHNQNGNLRPSDRMWREVCIHCHSAGFSLAALVDADLVARNFYGAPARDPDERGPHRKGTERCKAKCKAVTEEVHPGSLRVGILAAAAGALSCRPVAPPAPTDEAALKRELTDAVHEVLSADREIYTKHVVNRLQNEDKVLKASEHWKDDKALPLPAQMFRMGAERVREKTKSFSYALLSLTPINKQNRPRTEVETRGLTAVTESPGQNHYADEVLAETRYFTAVYPDRAVSEACVECHNKHPDSPRQDYKLGDVMGGIVIRVVADVSGR